MSKQPPSQPSEPVQRHPRTKTYEESATPSVERLQQELQQAKDQYLRTLAE